MSKALAILDRIDRILTLALKTITIVVFLALTAIITANILLRFFPFTSLHWMDEIVEMCFAALVFYGAAGVWMVKGHFSVGDWFAKVTRSARARSVYRFLLELVTFVFAGALFFYSLSLVTRSIEVTAVFQIPKKVLYSCMPISSLIMVAYSATYVIREGIGVLKPRAPAP
jgi:TRAP-type C4-dicarboxylate transport system permease small subunit